MFYANAFGLRRVVVVGPLAYLALIAVLRIAGKLQRDVLRRE